MTENKVCMTFPFGGETLTEDVFGGRERVGASKLHVNTVGRRVRRNVLEFSSYCTEPSSPPSDILDRGPLVTPKTSTNDKSLLFLIFSEYFSNRRETVIGVQLRH